MLRLNKSRISWLCFKLQKRLLTDAASKQAPLSDIRVLDLSRVLAGPYATMCLGDLGAEIIKVERPGVGDETRTWGPPFLNTESCYFLSVNRNKKSITINTKHPKGIDVIKKLAMVSDVLIENFLPGTMDKLGLGFQELHKTCPALIYCSVTGHGPDGPWAHRPGYDIMAQAAGGLMHITGPQEGDPCKVGVAITDIMTGLYAHGAIMAALLEREKTGIGQKIDCSLLSSQVAMMSHIATAFLNADREAERLGTSHQNIVPYQAFKAKDGFIIIGAGNNKLYTKFCELIDLKELIDDPLYCSNHERVKNRKALVEILDQRFLTKTVDEWLHVFEGSGIPYSPINNISQVFQSPQVQFKKMVQEMEHPTAGTIKVPGPAVEFNGRTELTTPSPPPLLGQHTEEILRDILDYDMKSVQEMLDEGVVG